MAQQLQDAWLKTSIDNLASKNNEVRSKSRPTH